MSDYFAFKPIYQERVWGGRKFEAELGRTLPAAKVIGESWEMVDRPEAQSVVSRGTLAGKTLRDLLEMHTAAIMGPGWDANRPFPILVKWLDCSDRLSLQVHPPAEIAPSLNGEPKTENWYIGSAAPGAQLIVGLKKGVTPGVFEKAIDDQTLESCVNRFPVSSGDSILVRSGQIHAIDAGNLILEIQQNSDTTYRVYDWGRVGLDGKPRTLHVEESLKSISWDAPVPTLVKASAKSEVIADCREFRIRRVSLGSGEIISIKSGEQPRILSVVDGSVGADGSSALVRGDNILLPYSAPFSFTALKASTVLITENFI